MTVPDDNLTPGAIASHDPAVVCAFGYARSQRLYETDQEAYWRAVRRVLDAYHVRFADRPSSKKGGTVDPGFVPPQDCSMPSKRTDLRLPRIIHAYIDELAKVGVYGRGRGGVIRRLIEQGIQNALEARVISPKNLGDFKGASEEGVTVEEE